MELFLWGETHWQIGDLVCLRLCGWRVGNAWNARAMWVESHATISRALPGLSQIEANYF